VTVNTHIIFLAVRERDFQ